MSIFDSPDMLAGVSQNTNISPLSGGSKSIFDSPDMLSTVKSTPSATQPITQTIEKTNPIDTSSLFGKTSSFLDSFSTPKVSANSTQQLSQPIDTSTIKINPNYTSTGSTISSAPKESLWDKAIAPVKEALFGEDTRVERVHETIVDNQLLNLGKQLGIDKTIPVDSTKDHSVQQYYQDKAITDYVRNNYDTIRSSLKDPTALPEHPDMLSPGFSDINKNIEGYAKKAGIDLKPNDREMFTKAIMLPVTGAFLVSNPLAFAGYAAFGKVESALTGGGTVADKTAETLGLSNGAKDALNLVEMFAVGGVMHGISTKVSPDLIQKWTKNITTEYMPGKTIRFEPAQIHAALNRGVDRGIITPEEESIINGAVGKGGAGAWKAAIKDGTSIDVAPEKVVTIADKPYWAKIKGLVGQSTDPTVTRISMGDTSIGAESRASRLLGAGNVDTLKKGADIIDKETQDHLDTHGVGLTTKAATENLGMNQDHATSLVDHGVATKSLEAGKINNSEDGLLSGVTINESTSKEIPIPEKKPVTSSLEQEATKYKSADEFVKAHKEIPRPEKISSEENDFIKKNSVQRIEEPNVDVSFDKPQGLYTTPNDVESPHTELGGEKHIFHIDPNSKVATVDTSGFSKTPYERGVDQMASSLVWLRKELPEVANNIRGKSFNELKTIFQKEYPKVSWDKYTEKQDIIEGYAGIKAREKGIDIIHGIDKDDPRFSEKVILNKDKVISEADLRKIYQEKKKVNEKTSKETPYTPPKVTLNEAGTHAMVEGADGKTVMVEGLKKGEDPLSKLTPEQAKDFGVQISTEKGREEASTKPVGEGEIKTSRLAERLGAEKSVEYKVAEHKTQEENAKAFVDKYPERADRVAKGLEKPPEGLLKNHIVNEVRNRTTKGSEDFTDILNKQTLEGTRHGQEIEALKGQGGENTPEGTLKEVIARKIESSIVYKKEGTKGITKAIDKGVKEVTEKMNKVKMKTKEFENIINSLTC